MGEVSTSEGADCGALSDVRLTLIGQIPPPVHGQSVVTSVVASFLAPHFRYMRIVNTSEGTAARWQQLATKVSRSALAVWALRSSDAVYIAVNGGRGMWLTTVIAGLARLANVRIFLHHHSYSYIRERKSRMVALTRAAGPDAYHIVLSRTMAADLIDVIPEVRRTLVCGPACCVDKGLLESPLRADNDELVLGHLSILVPGKGVAEVVDLAVALHRAGKQVRLLVGGPTPCEQSRLHLDHAARELGALFEYRGQLGGDSKRDFFREITHFILPSRYVHEAVPVVLFEAMAAGAVCIATRRGSIAEQLQDSPSVLADSADSFVEEIFPILVRASASTAASRASREAFLRKLAASERNLADLVRLMAKQN